MHITLLVLQQLLFEVFLTVGLVIDASSGFRWPEDVECITSLLSTILGDTANVQIVVMLPEACSLPISLWTVETPPCMTK